MSNLEVENNNKTLHKQDTYFLEEITSVFTQTSNSTSILSNLLNSSIIVKVRNGSRTLFDRTLSPLRNLTISTKRNILDDIFGF